MEATKAYHNRMEALLLSSTNHFITKLAKEISIAGIIERHDASYVALNIFYMTGAITNLQMLHHGRLRDDAVTARLAALGYGSLEKITPQS